MDFIDYGVGMPEETVKNIFNLDSSHWKGSINEKGTGFGLSIVKAYTLLFGGKIEVVSSQKETSRGTTFSLYLPQISKDPAENNTYMQ